MHGTRDYQLVILLILAKVIVALALKGTVSVTGPSNKTAQEGTNVQMECSVTGVNPLPLLRWRISGREYTPSTLPDRYFPTSTGLLIYSVSPDDDGVTVQCFIVLYDPSISPPFVVVNSSVGVVHVIPRDHTGQVSSLLSSTATPTPMLHQSIIITTFPSPTIPSVGYLLSISEILAIFLVVAILTLILTSSVVFCLALHLIRRRGHKVSSANREFSTKIIFRG